MNLTFQPAKPFDTPGQLIPGEEDWPEEINLNELPVFGAADDDEEEEEEDDEDEEDPDDVVEKLSKDADDAAAAKNGKRARKTTPPASKYVPPSEAEWRKVQAALARSNQNQRERRQAALERAKAEGLSEGEAKARTDAEEAATAKYQPQIITYEAKLALAAAGCQNPKRLSRLIDHEAITVVDKGDGEFELVGLEEQINSLQEEWPELFKTTDDNVNTGTPKPRGKDLSGSDRSTPRKTGGKTATEKALDRLRGF